MKDELSVAAYCYSVQECDATMFNRITIVGYIQKNFLTINEELTVRVC